MALYDFVDTTEVPDSSRYPAEALCLNGAYLEDAVDGYRTLYVTGREALSPELTSYETGIRDGSILQSRRYPARTITVGYLLKASDVESFRSAYNTLASVLDVEEAELIFADEPDKYFTGTPSGLGEIDAGTNNIKGEFTIYCADPFKYSVDEYEVEPSADDESTFVIDYNGTYKAHPVLEADFYEESEASSDGSAATALTGSGDCGFVAFFDANGNIIQLGDPDEEDTEEYDKSQTLVSQKWQEVSAWTTALNSLWTKNAGRVTDSIKSQTGTPGFALSDATGNYGYYLTAKSYGSDTSGYHGPTVTRTIPADANGDTGAEDFTFSWSMKVNIGNSSTASANCGCIQVLLCDDDDVIVAGMSIFKSGSGSNATMRMYVRTQIVKDVTIDLSYRNKRFGTNASDGSFTSVKSCSITKTGCTVAFNLGGSKYSFTDAKLSGYVTTKFTATFGQYKEKSVLPWIGIYSFKFVKNNCETWRDIPNKFSANDVVIADCGKAEILLNDSPAPELGALGNAWEDFCLLPGQNQIGATYSDWVEDGYEPTFKIRYREVFL